MPELRTGIRFRLARFSALFALCASASAETIKDYNATVADLRNRTLVLTGIARVTVNDSIDPLRGSSLDLLSDDAWLFFPSIKPSVFDSLHLGKIKVKGAAAVPDQNVRLEPYLRGCVLIAHPSTYQPLEIFSQTDFAGTAMKLGLYTYHRAAQLGSLDNATRSFKLKRGYMATVAQNEDGTGRSRVWVADRADVDIPSMPSGLSGSVSFVRVFPWRWTAKKGWTNGLPAADALNASWWYNWDNAAASTKNVEYVPMRSTLYWNAYANINDKRKATHALGFNEPDRPDQANMTVAQAIAEWPQLLKSGLRLGAPAPSDASVGTDWLFAFMDKADSLGYRVDFVPVHWYKGGQTAAQFYGWLKWVHERTKRPIWITEWNNGANWTCCKPTYDEQARTIGEMIAMMDTARFVERYSIYEWVEDTRQMFSTNPTVLTKAGGVYRDHVSAMAYHTGFAEAAYGACIASDISPNILHRGAWSQSAFASVAVGDSVSLSPWPWAGGTWSWSGPAGFQSTERTIVLPKLQAAQAGAYLVTHTNNAGCKSSFKFDVLLRGADSSTAVAPARSSGRAWIAHGGLRLEAAPGVRSEIVVMDLAGRVVFQRTVAGSASIGLKAIGARGFAVLRVQQEKTTLLEEKVVLFER